MPDTLLLGENMKKGHTQSPSTSDFGALYYSFLLLNAPEMQGQTLLLIVSHASTPSVGWLSHPGNSSR
jgi:hypothetical protein